MKSALGAKKQVKAQNKHSPLVKVLLLKCNPTTVIEILTVNCTYMRIRYSVFPQFGQFTLKRAKYQRATALCLTVTSFWNVHKKQIMNLHGRHFGHQNIRWSITISLMSDLMNTHRGLGGDCVASLSSTSMFLWSSRDNTLPSFDVSVSSLSVWPLARLSCPPLFGEEGEWVSP